MEVPGKELLEDTLEEKFKDKLEEFPRTESHELPDWKNSKSVQWI